MKALGSVQYWRDVDLPGLEIARIHRSEHVFPKHTHEYYAIGLMEHGACYGVDGGASDLCVETGQVMLIGPGQVHSGNPATEGPVSYRMLYVDPTWMHRAACELADTEMGYAEFPHLVAQDPAMYAMLRRLSLIVASGGEVLRKQSAMVGSFARLLTMWGRVRDRSPRGPEHRAVRLVGEYLAAHVRDKVTLDELAAHAGLSRYYLLRVFKRETGMTPHAYHVQLRLEHAKGLMLSGLPLADVALDCGFTDQSHFSNAFRRYTGATPGQYLAS